MLIFFVVFYNFDNVYNINVFYFLCFNFFVFMIIVFKMNMIIFNYYGK